MDLILIKFNRKLAQHLYLYSETCLHLYSWSVAYFFCYLSLVELNILFKF